MPDTYDKLESGFRSPRSRQNFASTTFKSIPFGLTRRWLVKALLLIMGVFIMASILRRFIATPITDPYSTVPELPSPPFTISRPRQPYVELSRKDGLARLHKAQSVVKAFTSPKFRPQCATLSSLDARFHSLAPTKSNTTIFFAINLVNSQNILPTFIHEITTVMTFMGPHRFHLHVWENGSSDRTGGLLVALSNALDELGVSYEIVFHGTTLTLDKSNGRRIIELAKVRNNAMEPLYDGTAAKFMGIEKFDLVVFMNDIIWCASDLLEILYEHNAQGADMTCTTDWGGQVVYDRWVARTILGQPFYHQADLIGYFNDGRQWNEYGPIPPYPEPLTDEPSSREKFIALNPMQVFSCWNGAVVMKPEAFFPAHAHPYPNSGPEEGMKVYTTEEIRFRTAKNDVSEVTDRASECYLVCVDFWRRGLGKILLVPRAAVTYDLTQYNLVRQDGGRTKPHPVGIEPVTHYKAPPSKPVEWILEPPEKVAYHDYAWWHEKERWGPWDEE